MFESLRSREKTRRDAEALARDLSGQSLQGAETTSSIPQTRSTATPQHKLTGGAKFIAGYVLIASWAALGRHEQIGTAIRTGEVRPLQAGIIFSGLAGAILLFRKKRAAKYAFLLWTALIITSLAGALHSAGESLAERLYAGAFVGGIFLLINREVDRNVGAPPDDD